MPVLLGYTGLTDNLRLKYIDDSKPLWDNSSEELRYTSIGSVIGTHAGPGAIAVAFFKKNA
jgi:fatty acid-binding protein DegV